MEGDKYIIMEARNDLLLLLFILIALWVAWVVSGGPDRFNSRSPIIQNPTTSSHSSDTVEDSSFTDRASSNDSPNTSVNPSSPDETTTEKTQLSFVRTTSGAKRTNAQEEYVRIRADRSNTKPVRITGLVLHSDISGRSYTIPQGTPLYLGGQINAKQDVYLAPKEEAIIVTGRSPIGTSFRTNSCTGYLEQFQDFSPSLSRSCPSPRKEFDTRDVSIIHSFGDECIDFIERMPSCKLNLKPIPLGFPEQCVRFITEDITYNGCVKNHKNDDDFYDNEWRLYLGRNEEVWRAKRETIELATPDGTVLDTLSY
jgi:hypothetical protein